MVSPHIHIPFERIQHYLPFIKVNRLGTEIFFSGSALDTIGKKEVASLKEGFDNWQTLSIHAPFMDLSPGAVDPKIREVTVGRFSSILDIAEILRPLSIVFHSGYEKWKYALKTDIWLKQSLLTWQPLNERAKSIGVKLAIENIFEDEPSSLRLLMEGMDSDNFGVCFDTGHFNLFTKEPLQTWLDQLNPYIIELHLHDNRGAADEHLAMGDGNFDFQALFSMLARKDCVYTIEAHSPEKVLRSLDYLKKL